jgi:ATP:ADP antiporter, AAA family
MFGKFFNLTERTEERKMIIIMLGIGFFMGVFNATYQVVADAIFLKRLPEQLNNAFLTAGFLGIFVTALFSFFQNRIRFSTLITLSLSIIVLFTATVYWAYHFGPAQYNDLVVYMMYCATGPISAILLMSYWGVFGRLFDFRQSKRIISWIDSGQLMAAIIAFFMFPLTSSFLGDTSNYLIVSTISIVIAAILLIITSSNFTLARNDPRELGDEFKKETRVGKVLKDPYGLSLSAFAVVSMICFVFTQFSFQQLSNTQYPDQKDLANFLAYFNGSIYLISLLMQTFVNDKILGNYGLRITLFGLPVVLIFFSIAAALTGSIFGTSPANSPTGFIFFFLFIALTRWFNWMLRDSLETPIFKLFFIPIDSRFRFGIQSKVEGVINESGRFFAGAIIFGLSIFAIFNVIWISVLIMLAGVVYFYFISNLYNGYRSKIREKLETKDVDQEKLEFGLTALMKKLEAFLFHSNPSRSVFSFKLLEKINPTAVSGWVNALMKNESDEVQNFAQTRMNEIKGLTVSERYIIHSKQEVQGKIMLSKSQIELMLRSGGEITRTRIQQLARSPQAEDRLYASELLLHSTSEENLSFLIELLNDADSKVRTTALKTASKRFNDEVIFVLIENLSNQTFSNYAVESLVIIGGKALSHLENAFYRAGQLNTTLIKIVQIMGRIGGNKAKDMLWNKIDYPDKVVVMQVLLALGESGFKAGVSQITRIKYAIEADIADVSWNLNALYEVGDNGEVEELKNALRVEIKNDIEHLYKLMAMLYDTRSIQLVKENIESGTAEGATYAVELLDIFLSDQLKQRIIPVLDDLSDSEKISRLEVLYPRVKLDEKLVLKFLINRDFTQSNRWTKACALHRIGTLKFKDFTIDLIAQLFNPDQLIKEVAAWSLYQIDNGLYQFNTARLGIDAKAKLDQVILSSTNSQLMEFEKIKFFHTIGILKDIPGITLSFLADISEEIRLHQNEVFKIDNARNIYFYLTYQGMVEYYAKGKMVKEFSRGEFIGEMLSGSGYASSNLIQAKSETILLKIRKDSVYELLADKISLTEKFLEFI